MNMSRRMSRRRAVPITPSNAFTGRRTYPSEYPGVVIGQPWNSAVVLIRKGSSSKLSLKVDDVRTAMKNQLGLNNIPESSDTSKNVQFELRLQHIAIWFSADKGKLCVMPMDVVNNSSSRLIELARLDSYGVKNMYARVGYDYPLSIKSVPLSTATDFSQPIAEIYCTGTGDLEIHLSVLWKCSYSVLSVLEYVYPTPNDDDAASKQASFEVLPTVPIDVQERLNTIEDLLLRLCSHGSPPG